MLREAVCFSFLAFPNRVLSHFSLSQCLLPTLGEMGVFLLYCSEAQQIFCNNNRPWKGSWWLRTPQGWNWISGWVSAGSILFQESCVAPWVLWKNRTAGFHRLDVSVPSEVLGWLEGESIRKRKEKEAGVWEQFQMHSPLCFSSLPWGSSAARVKSAKSNCWIRLSFLYLLLRVVTKGWWLTGRLHCSGCLLPSRLDI